MTDDTEREESGGRTEHAPDRRTEQVGVEPAGSGTVGPGTPPTAGGAATAGPAVAVAVPRPRAERWRPFLLSLAFLGPALVMLGFLVLYPIFYSIYRSLYDK